jgi:hypothetical protein
MQFATTVVARELLDKFQWTITSLELKMLD